MATLRFDCPRCHTPSEAEFYGPCDECRERLRATMRIDARTVDSDYEPKINVTPNAVALKDD